VVEQAELEALAAEVGRRLLERGEWLATAESCTGGWVAQAVTAIAGSSAWFDRGFVAYSNAAKADLLGVPAATLERHGAVSEATARAMAQGAVTHSRADWALAVTGIAGKRQLIAVALTESMHDQVFVFFRGKNKQIFKVETVTAFNKQVLCKHAVHHLCEFLPWLATQSVACTPKLHYPLSERICQAAILRIAIHIQGKPIRDTSPAEELQIFIRWNGA